MNTSNFPIVLLIHPLLLKTNSLSCDSQGKKSQAPKISKCHHGVIFKGRSQDLPNQLIFPNREMHTIARFFLLPFFFSIDIFIVICCCSISPIFSSLLLSFKFSLTYKPDELSIKKAGKILKIRGFSRWVLPSSRFSHYNKDFTVTSARFF